MVTLGANDNHEEAPTRAHQGFLSYAPREDRERGRVAKQSPTREGVSQNFGTETYRNLPGQKRKSLLIMTTRHRPQTMPQAALEAALRQWGFTGANHPDGKPGQPDPAAGFLCTGSRRSRDD